MNASSSAPERLGVRDRQLGDLAGECRGVSADHLRVADVRSGERQPLGQVVELEHALLPDHDQLASLRRGQPVDVEHPGRPGREVEQPEEQVLVIGVLALGELGEHAGRSLAGDPRQDVDVVGGEVDGHADVADPGRERAGPAADDGIHGAQPAGAEQSAELEDRGVEPLHVADLDGHAPVRGRVHDPERIVDRPGERLLDEDRDAALDRGERQRQVGVGRAPR